MVENRANEKQQSILANAMCVFAKEGFGNTDVQVIADLAGVGKGTVYRHFGNKQQLFLATAKYCLEQLGEFVQQRVGAIDAVGQLAEELGVSEVLRRIAAACAEFYERHPQAIEIMIQERAEFRDSVYPSHLMYRAETRSELDRMLGEAVKRGTARQVDAVQAANAFADLLYGSLVNGCLEGSKGQLVDRVTQATDILLHGLLANSEATDDRR